MKKEFLVVACLLIISNIALAQWPAQSVMGGGRGADVGGRMIRQHMPEVQRELAPFIKGDQALTQTWDPNIAKSGNNPDGMAVTCFAEDSDNLYVGGDFRDFDTVSAANFIVHYNRKTHVWNALDQGVYSNVLALVVHGGKLYAAGNFVHAGSAGVVVNFISMWDGTAWNNLGGGMNNSVTALAFIGDTLYAGGDFTQAGGNVASFLAYWDGHTWQEAFGGTSYPVSALVVAHDSLFVGGQFDYVGSETRNTGILVRGTAMLHDGNWSPLGTGYFCNCLAIFQGKLWAGGYYFLNDGTLANEIASWDGSSWTIDSSDTHVVGTNATGDVAALVAVGDTLLALGNFSNMAGAEANGIAMYHNGIWSSLAGGIYGEGIAGISFDGKLYIGGSFTQAGTAPAMAIASLSNGSWTSVASMHYPYVGWQSDQVLAIATTDRYVFIGGLFQTIAGQTCNHIAAWDKQSGQWITLGAGVDGEVRSLAVKADTLIVGGDFNHAGSIPTRHIAMFNMSTKLWYAMGTGAYRYVSAIAVHADSIYAPIGYNYNGTFAYDYLGQWNGSSWNTYGNGLEAGYIDALAWHNDSLYAAGEFRQSDDGTPLNYVAELLDGTWGALNGGLNSSAYCLAVSGDSLYVGGDFTLADGQEDTALAVWNGTNWNPIAQAGCNGGVLALASDGKGGIYAGGYFTEVAQLGRGELVHWNGSSFGTVGSGVNNEVQSLATDVNALYAGGWFEEAGSNHTISLHFGAIDGAGADVTSVPEMGAQLSIFPNPVSTSSVITLDLTKSSKARLELFNALGDRVRVLADGEFDSGERSFTFDGHALPSGLYFLRLMANEQVTSHQIVIEH